MTNIYGLIIYYYNLAASTVAPKLFLSYSTCLKTIYPKKIYIVHANKNPGVLKIRINFDTFPVQEK